jgi:predicted alpha/beta hydrolase family esterase
MKQALIFHGTCDKEEYYSDNYPSLSNSHWTPWLQKQLLIAGWESHAPEVFEAYAPTYRKWLGELERYTVDSDTVLVGHSCGGGFLLRWMHENSNVEFKKVILVAPWLDPDETTSGDMFKVDFNIKNQDKVVVYESDDDMDSIKNSVLEIKNFMPDAKYIAFSGYGHFCYEYNMTSLEFPELLKEINT